MLSRKLCIRDIVFMQMDSSSSLEESAQTREQYAVVVANSKYDSDALKVAEPGEDWSGNPSFDARMMLRKLGLRRFEVLDVYDRSGEQLRETFSDFVAAFHERQLKPSAEKEVRS